MSTFETLPNEILMNIVRYSGNAYTIFRTFSGLNQRLNNILIDRCLHLFTDLLYTKPDDSDITYYYNCDSFHEICHQFSSLKTTEDDKNLHQCFQSLIASYIRETYNRLGDEFQSNIKQFQSIRSRNTTTVISNLDNELKKMFNYFPVNLCPQDAYCAWEPHFSSQSLMTMKQIESHVLTEGASLECDDDDEKEFNFAKAINKWLLAKANLTKSDDQQFINPLIQMFKASLISNPKLLKNKGYTTYNASSCYTHYFLIYSIYRLKYFHGYAAVRLNPINMHWYKAVMNLFLFAIHCLKHLFDKDFCLEDILLDILYYLNKVNLTEPSTYEEIFIRTSQMEILRIILHEYDLKDVTSCDKHDTFSQSICNLIKNNQLDKIRFIYSENAHIRNLFHRTKTSQQIVDIMTGNRKKRQLFKVLLSDIQLRPWLTSSDLLFILLQKKQCKLVKHLLKLSPLLVHRLDKDGNDALLYVCLKVRGCRHRLIKFLIEIGCDLQRMNSKLENFIDALQLTRNRTLLEKLIEHETIQIDNISTEIQVILTNQSQ
ncbi:unnamed protein product [Adineta steineri]|uniref:Ankyrin repeat-containing protein n=1 Tax=Adineta steineri TaxID=433720 RepID=A0A814L2Y8_9BILA|nr:unnamed protein product [Adineta steineri]